VQGKEFEFEPIRLRSVRPFIFEEFALAQVQAEDEGINLNSKVAVAKYLKSRVNQLIQQANDEWDEIHKDDGDEAEERLLPLIRIRVCARLALLVSKSH
jgi:double-strand break repair protein MRE11